MDADAGGRKTQMGCQKGRKMKRKRENRRIEKEGDIKRRSVGEQEEQISKFRFELLTHCRR